MSDQWWGGSAGGAPGGALPPGSLSPFLSFGSPPGGLSGPGVTGAAGQTFGKRVFGVAVRDSDVGDSIAPAGAALRYIVVGMYRVVLFFAVFTILDGLWPLWDKRRQALHDKIAGSLVIRVSRS